MTRRETHQLTNETVRLAQKSSEIFSLPFRLQLARCLVEQAIFALDAELGFMIDGQAALASANAIVRATQANDLVINGSRLDVRVLEGGEVKLDRSLLESGYARLGSLVVELGGTGGGTIIGFLDSRQWQRASAGEEENTLVLPFTADDHFDLAGCLKQLAGPDARERPGEKQSEQETPTPTAEELLTFVRDPKALSLQSKRSVLASALKSRRTIDNIEALDNLRRDETAPILRDYSAWEERIKRVVSSIAVQFPKLPEEQIAELVRQTGEQAGGQIDSPYFKETLCKTIARQHLAKRVSSKGKQRLTDLIEGVQRGKSAADAIKSLLKNKVAVDIATNIQASRSQVERFARASAEEIARAFQQLDLKPAYAPHSQDETGAIESINEALELYEIASVVEALMKIEFKDT